MIQPLRNKNENFRKKINDVIKIVDYLKRRFDSATQRNFTLQETPYRKGGSGGSNNTRRDICTADAGASSTITANLYHVTTGVEQTTGDEAGITVYCSVTGGADLNNALTRLEIGLDIPVYLSVYDNAGTPEPRWFFGGVFQESEDCTCGD